MTLAGMQDDVSSAGAHTATGASVGPLETSAATQYSCDRCGKTFRSMTRLRNHARTHPVDVAGLQINLDFLTQTNTSTTPGSPAMPSYQDELMGVRTEEVVTTGPETKPTSPTNPLASKTASRTSTSSNTSDVIRRTSRRRSGIPLPTDKIASMATRSARRSLQVTAMQNSHRMKTVAAELPLTPRRPSVEKVRGDGQRNPYRRHTLSSAAKETVPQSPLSSRTNNRKSRLFTSDQPNPNSQMINRHEETPTTPIRFRSTTPVTEKTSERANINKTFTASPRKSLAPTPLKTVTPKTSRTPKSAKLKQRSNSRTPNRKLKAGTSRTPNSSKKTPISAQKTPKSGKKTPKSNKTLLQKKGTPKTPKTPTGVKDTTPLGLNYRCTRCGKGFLSQRMLDLHYVIHVRDSPRACGIPSETIKKRPRRLKLANKTKPKPTPEAAPKTSLHACAKCSRVYEHEKFLAAHMKTHGIDHPHVCDICQKRFKFLSSLKSHKIVHVGEKSHNDTLKSIEKGHKTENRRSSKAYEAECDALNLIGSVRNVFSIVPVKESVIEYRGLIDGNDRVDDDLVDCAFVCTSCDFKTSHPVELLKHMKTHSTRRKYTCDKCDRSYASRSNLEVHGKVHVIERLRHVLTTKRKGQ